MHIISDLMGLEPPSRVVFSAVGALRISAPGGAVLVNGVEAGAAAYVARRAQVEIIQTGASDLSVEVVGLNDLDLDELQAVVEWADVETSAGTVSGLRRAIERHFEEG